MGVHRKLRKVLKKLYNIIGGILRRKIISNIKFHFSINIELNKILPVNFYTVNETEKITTTTYVDITEYVSLPVFCHQLVEWYVNDMDRNEGSAGGCGVHPLIRIPSLCHTVPVILREELPIN